MEPSKRVGELEPALRVGEASLPDLLVCDLGVDLLPLDLVLERAFELDAADADSSFSSFCSVLAASLTVVFTKMFL